MKSPEKKSTPIFYFELKNNIIAIVFIFILMTFLITNIMYKLIDNNITSILDRTLVVARAEYNRFYDESIHSFSLFRHVLTPNEIRTLQDFTAHSANYDFWVLISDKRIVATNGQANSPFAAELLKVAELCRQEGAPLHSSELSSLAALYEFSIPLGQKQSSLQPGLQIDDFARIPVLFQVVSIPLRSQSGHLENVILVGKILNNDNSIAENINILIPGTNSTISVRNGLRISGNIKSASHENYIGKLQEREHIDAVYSGNRFYGQIVLEDLNDKIVSEPIRNSRKEIVGALTVGFPYRQYADLKDNITLSIGVIGFISFLVALVANLILARKGSRPLIQLSSLSSEISQPENITSQYIKNLENIEAAEILEIRDLQYSFIKMASTLYDKNRENEAFLTELSRDKNELHHLTAELHQTNMELELRVRERTQDLQKAVRELTELNKMKTKFLSNMSHEIRTPLNSIIGFSDVLGEESFGALNAKQKEYIQIILNSAQHLLDLINDILDMSIIDQGRSTLHKQLENPNELVHSVVNVLRAQLERKQLHLNLCLDESISAILLDPVRIKQVLYNIVNNAIKFTPAGGTISISSKYEQQQVVMVIQDTGIGIAAEVQEKVFDEFFQAEHSYKKLFDGVGLGLPLSRKLLEMHGGTISLSSRIGEGTSITLSIPAQFLA